jgi:hypothetical protein
MTPEQYILTKIAEEASEVSKIALKAAQFGFDSFHPTSDKNNLTTLVDEVNDLSGAVLLLKRFLGSKEINIDGLYDKTTIENKVLKIMKYSKISHELGYLSGRILQPPTLWFMRDNHTFIKLPFNYTEALEIIQQGWDSGCNYGSFFTKDAVFSELGDISSNADWGKFKVDFKDWFDRANQLLDMS